MGMTDGQPLNTVMAKTKTTTCGVIVTDGDLMLICHPTNGRHWDIPKGRADPGEDHARAASRELAEETGMIVSHERLVYLGTHDYKPSKDLALFMYRTANMPDVDGLFCISEFDDNGTMTKEMDGFAVVPISSISEWMNDDMARVLSEVLGV